MPVHENKLEVVPNDSPPSVHSSISRPSGLTVITFHVVQVGGTEERRPLVFRYASQPPSRGS